MLDQSPPHRSRGQRFPVSEPSYERPPTADDETTSDAPVARFRTDAPPPAESAPSRTVAIGVGLAACVALVGGTVLASGSTSAEAPARAATRAVEETPAPPAEEAAPTEWVLELSGAPEGARVTRDGQPVADPSHVVLGGEPSAAVVLAVSAPGFISRELRIERGAFEERDDAMRARVTVSLDAVPRSVPRSRLARAGAAPPPSAEPAADPSSPLPENPF